MAIDARIPLMGQMPDIRPPDVISALERAEQLKQARRQGTLADMQLAQAQEERADQATLRDLYKRSITPDAQGIPQLDEQRFLSEYGQVNPEKALSLGMQLRKGRMDTAKAGMEAQKTAAETQKIHYETLHKQVSLVNQVASAILAADSQQAYEQGVATLQRYGIPTEHLPPAYNRQLVAQYAQESQDAGTRLQEMQLTQQAQLAREQQAVTMRGQDTAAATAREGHVVQREGHLLTAERAGQAMGQQQQRAQVETEAKLRDDFTQQTRNFREVRDAYGRIQASATEPSVAGDISIVFGYMKLLDPGSTVREGEQATMNNAGTIPEQVRGAYNRLITGTGRMEESLRNDFIDRAQRLYDQYERDYAQTEQQFRDMSQRSGANPANVIVNPRTTAPRQAAPNRPAAPPVTGPGQQGRVITEADIQATMQASGRTRAEVVQAFRAKGYEVR